MLATALLVAGVVALLAPKALLGSRWFLTFSDDHFAWMLDHHLSRVGEHNDVVILGDSAGMMGVDASIVESRTGLKTVNLSLYGNAGFDAWRLLIDHYLSRNAPPRLIVLYLVPESFAVNDQADRSRFSYESAQLEYRLAGLPLRPARLGHLVEGLSAVYTRVVGALENQLETLVRSRRMAELRAHHEAVDRYARDTRGGSRMSLIQIDWDHRPLDDSCAFTDEFALPLDGLLALRHHLEAEGARTLVFIAPTPACDRAIDRHRSALGAIAANPIAHRPNSDFYDRSHMTASACAAHSRELAAFVERALGG